jgi:hypothetical protein
MLSSFFGETFAKFPLQNLISSLGFGEGVQERDGGWFFVTGQILFAMIDNFPLGEGFSRLDHHYGLDGFPPFFVGHTNDHSLHNLGMLSQNLFHFLGVNV